MSEALKSLKKRLEFESLAWCDGCIAALKASGAITEEEEDELRRQNKERYEEEKHWDDMK